MILVFIVLGLIILINLIYLALLFSNLKFEIKKVYISNIKGKLETQFLLEINLYAFNKFKVFKISIDNDKITNLLNSGRLDIKKLKNNKEMNKEIIDILKNNHFEIELLTLEGYFATVNTVVSGIIYGTLNAILPILVGRKIKQKDYKNNIRFLNVNKNIINIHISCIINVKIVNIIKVLYVLKKKGGKDKHGKSSNRRSYAYSNE